MVADSDDELVLEPLMAGDVEEALALTARERRPEAWSRSQLLDELGSRASDCVRARIGLDLVGFAVLRTGPDDGELFAIAVAPGRRRTGVGGRLVRAVADRARERGAARLLLEVRASNEPALALYRREGFTESGRRPGYYRDPREDAVLLELDLGRA